MPRRATGYKVVQVDGGLIAESSATVTGDVSGEFPVSGGSGASGLALARTAVKTSTYTAAAGDLVPCDPTGGAFTVTLPSAPADKTAVAVKIVTATAPNAVTVACGGSDTFNRATGSPATSLSLSLPGQAVLLVYDSATLVWTILADDLPLSQLDARFAATSLVTAGSLGATPSLNMAAQVNPKDVFYTGTLTANAVLTVTNFAAGAVLTIGLTQDSTGFRSFAITAAGSTAQAIPVVLNPAASTLLQFFYDGTDLYAKGA